MRIVPAVIAEMLEHARESAPNECCGLLVGRRGSIEGSIRAKNLQQSPTRYLIDPVDHFAAIHAARARGQAVVGAYHSHPNTPPTPSESDLSEATGSGDFLYVIVSPGGSDTGAGVVAYRFHAGVATPVLLEPAAE